MFGGGDGGALLLSQAVGVFAPARDATVAGGVRLSGVVVVVRGSRDEDRFVTIVL